MANKVDGTCTLDSAPVQGVEIDVVSKDGAQSLGRTTTDANGEYSVNVGDFADDVLVSANIKILGSFSEMVAATSNVTIEGALNTVVRQSVNTGSHYNARSSMAMPSNTGIYYWQVNAVNSGTQVAGSGVVSDSALTGLSDTNSSLFYQDNPSLNDSIGTASTNDSAIGGSAYRVSSNSVNEGYVSIGITPNVDLRRTYVFDSATTEFFVYSESGALLGSKQITQASHNTNWYMATSVTRSNLTFTRSVTAIFDPSLMFTLPSSLPSGAKPLKAPDIGLIPQVKVDTPTEIV